MKEPTLWQRVINKLIDYIVSLIVRKLENWLNTDIDGDGRIGKEVNKK